MANGVIEPRRKAISHESDKKDIGWGQISQDYQVAKTMRDKASAGVKAAAPSPLPAIGATSEAWFGDFICLIFRVLPGVREALPHSDF